MQLSMMAEKQHVMLNANQLNLNFITLKPNELFLCQKLVVLVEKCNIVIVFVFLED